MDKQNKEIRWFETLSVQEPDIGEKDRNHSKSGTTRKRMADKGKSISLEKYTEEAGRWIDEVAVLMKAENRKDRAWNALRGVLHGLRDRTSPEEVFHFSAQLPMLIRGLFLEGYKIGNKPEKYHAEELKDRINTAMGPGAEIEPETAFKAVLLVLHNHVSEGELDDIYRALPKDIRRLWKKSMETYTV